MAEMIPDKMPKRASIGEKRLFGILQYLPDDYIIYYEPIIDQRYPDFIIISPDIGLLIIEVKAWRAGDIIDANPQSIVVKQFGKEVKQAHPLRKARDYMVSLMTQCQQEDWARYLIQRSEDNKSRFVFPIGHFALLSQVSSKQLVESSKGSVIKVLPPERVAYKEILDRWEKTISSSSLLINELRRYFSRSRPFKPLTLTQIEILRALIHPEILIQKPILKQDFSRGANQNKDGVGLKIMDLKQEQNARSIGSGHRIVYGVAGSGKTILLIARAHLLAREDPDLEILVLCYNVTLSSYLQSSLADCPNVKVFHFDGWAKENGISRKYGDIRETDAQFGQRFLEFMQTEEVPDYRKYDAILIDESQDFEPIWFKCVLNAMKDPEDGDLVIVGDGNQGLYRRHRIRWSELGINARGRTVSAKFDLDKNYRNTRQIVKLAQIFSATDDFSVPDELDDTILSLSVDPEKCTRSGPKPVLIQARSKEDELERCTSVVKSLLSGDWFGQTIEPLKPREIGIFYPRLTKRMENEFRLFIDKLNQEIAPVTWLSNKSNRKARVQIADPTVKVQTIHSAKGLQYRAVYILWADELPSGFDDSDEQVDRQLFYVALTRAEDYLVISHSGASSFIREIQLTDFADPLP